MKNVFLIGDSIRFGASGSPGYGCFVREKLQGIANVLYPDENCRFAEYTLRYLHEWAQKVDRDSIDVVHWNNGLWDALRLYGDEPLTPIDMYTAMLERIYKRIRPGCYFRTRRSSLPTPRPLLKQKCGAIFFVLIMKSVPTMKPRKPSCKSSV